MPEPNAPTPRDDETDHRSAETDRGDAPPTGEVMEAEEGGTQEPLDGP